MATGTGAVSIPFAAVTGHDASDRPTYNEFIPSLMECYEAFMRLMPFGRAHQTHDMSLPVDSSVIRRFWYAFSFEWANLEQKVVEMLDEAFCAFASLNLDAWKLDYLTDPTDPFAGNVCLKVGSVGPLTIAEMEWIAEQMGWVAEFRWLRGDDAEFPGIYSTLYIGLDAAASPSVPAETAMHDETALEEPWVFGEDGVELGPFDTAFYTSLVESVFDKLIAAHNAIDVEIV